jgi:DNA-binding transcriptional LysR family regulator
LAPEIAWTKTLRTRPKSTEATERSTKLTYIVPPAATGDGAPDIALRQREVLEPHDFEGETFISLSAGSTGRHLIDQAFHRDDVRRVLRIETTLSEIMCGLVSSGLGVAICDPFAAQEFATRGVVVRRFVPRIDFEFAAVFPAQRSSPPVVLDLVQTMREALDGLAAGQIHRELREGCDLSI